MWSSLLVVTTTDCVEVTNASSSLSSGSVGLSDSTSITLFELVSVFSSDEQKPNCGFSCNLKYKMGARQELKVIYWYKTKCSMYNFYTMQF